MAGTNIISSTYLIFYNALLVIGWSLIGLIIGQHLLSEGTHIGLYKDVEPFLKIFQTAAVLEVVHCAVGIVRSSVIMTAFQVTSRVTLVWGILHSVAETQDNGGFPLLLVAWTITEIIRYSFYIINLAQIQVTPVLWLRYTLFIVLYPIGVTGELLCVYQALPVVLETEMYSLRLPNKMNFAFDYHIFLIIFMLTYIPIFPQLYLHMFAQRKKVLGGSTKMKSQ